MQMDIEYLKSTLRTIPDFPLKGILFWDVTTLFKDSKAFAMAADAIYDLYKDKGVTKVVSLESRGFVLGSVLAYKLGAGFVPIRKPGKLPADKLVEAYTKEYGLDNMEIHQDALNEDDVVLLHDDLIATGGSAAAAIKLIKEFSPRKIYSNFIIELESCNGLSLIPEDIETTALLRL